jgi:nucleoside-diphosphate-sugar epimerase
MHVLVTGAGGYIGTTLVPRLLAAGHRVTAVDRFFFGRHLLEDHARLAVVREDTRKLEAGRFEGVEAVIDLAALSNDPAGELFHDSTWAINFRARARTAELARKAGAKRYLLPSSCSIYGWLDSQAVADETHPVNPLTTYARANRAAEEAALALAGRDFCVVVLRQATVYGCSPRMRFDLAVNGMTFGAWKTGKLPLMRDGTQWRPMVHVEDAAAALLFMLSAEASRVNGEIFNVGSAANVYQISALAEIVARLIPRRVEIAWYGDPDKRSYRAAFGKIEGLGYKAARTAEDGVRELVEKLEAGAIDRTPETITLDWYRTLVEWHRRIKDAEMYGGIVDI